MLNVTASLMADWVVGNSGIPASGSCSGAGKAVGGRSRPLNPSGDDWRDALVGLVVEEGALAPKPAAADEFTIKGTEVVAGRFEAMWANGEAGREASKLAPLGADADEVVGVMFSSRGPVINVRLLDRL